MNHTIRILAAAAALALAGCSPMGAAAPGSGRPFGPGYGQGPGGGYGPGYGPGYGMMAPGYGMMGPGMMMGGPGMMTGPGMMAGPGMPGGWGGLPANLTAEQRSKIAEIRRDQRSRLWPLMQQTHELMWADGGAEPGAFDEQAQRRD